MAIKIYKVNCDNNIN